MLIFVIVLTGCIVNFNIPYYYNWQSPAESIKIDAFIEPNRFYTVIETEIKGQKITFAPKWSSNSMNFRTPGLQFYLNDHKGWATFYLSQGHDGFLEVKDHLGEILANSGTLPIPQLDIPLMIKFEGKYYTVNCYSSKL